MNVAFGRPAFEQDTAADRRQTAQPTEREIGRLISCSGSKAVISNSATDLAGSTAEFWSIGRLITINIETSRIIGVVYEVNTKSELWDDENGNIINVKVELVGEINDRPDGGVEFRRGITTYPYLGAVAHRIRAGDLSAMYELGEGIGVEIGRLSQDERIAATVNVDALLKRHFAVVGTTGVGKSSAVSLLLHKAVESRPNLRVLVLDPHNEYAGAFHGKGISLDAASLDLPFWIFRFDELVDVVFRGRPPVPGEADILQEMVTNARARYQMSQTSAFSSSLIRRPIGLDSSKVTVDMPVPYRISDVFTGIDEAMGKLEARHNRADMRSLKVRLEALCHDPRFRFMFGRTTVEDNLERIIAQIFRIPKDGLPITILQLAGIPSEVVNALVSLLARMAFDVAMLSQGRFEVLIMCEEAHRYVPQDPNLGFAPTRAALARIAKEGRKYGAYLGVVTQRPGELDPTILSQCSTVFAMRLANEHDQEIIRSAISGSSESTISFLSSLGQREAIAFGEAIATPMRMKFTLRERHQLPAMSGDGESARQTDHIDLAGMINYMRGMSGMETI
jgi:uncharacterized protein